MRCVCGHDQEDHGHDDEFPGSTACTECEDCVAFEATEDEPGTADGDVNVLEKKHFGNTVSSGVEAESGSDGVALTSIPHPASPSIEYTVVVELHRQDPATEPRRLIKFPGFQQALSSPLVPSSSRIWVSRATFLANADPLEYEDLVDFHDAAQKAVSDDVVEARMTLKSRMFDRLLDTAWTPEQAAQELGVRASKESKMARKTNGASPKAKAPKTPRAPKAEGAYTRLAKDGKITVLAEKNPKREGTESYDRFKLYKTGMTVAAFLDKGGKSIDLSYDAKKGYIKVDAPAA